MDDGGDISEFLHYGSVKNSFCKWPSVNPAFLLSSELIGGLRIISDKSHRDCQTTCNPHCTARHRPLVTFPPPCRPSSRPCPPACPAPSVRPSDGIAQEVTVLAIDRPATARQAGHAHVTHSGVRPTLVGWGHSLSRFF